MNKYKNKKIIHDGIKFDSIKEKDRYIDLKIMQKAGLIHNLQVKPVYTLIPKNKYNGVCSYIADFSYNEIIDDEMIVEDVKPFNKKTGKFLLLPVYKIKKKLMYDRFKIIIKEV